MNTIGTIDVSMDDMLQTTAAVVDPSTEEEEDEFFTPAMLAEIDQALADYHSGKNKVVATFRTHEDVDKYFDSLCSTK